MLNGDLPYVKCSVATLIILLGGCTSYHHDESLKVRQSSKVANPEYHCENEVVRSNDVLPTILYKKMNVCIAGEAWSQAVYLYALAGSSTWYDAFQIDTQFARSTHSRLLKESMDNLDNNHRNNFWQHMQSAMSDASKKAILCKHLFESGAPTYRPDYMLLSASSHGGRQYSTAIDWEKSVNSYVDCGSENPG